MPTLVVPGLLRLAAGAAGVKAGVLSGVVLTVNDTGTVALPVRPAASTTVT